MPAEASNVKTVHIPYHMEFAFDPAESATNLAKHGIDILQAQVFWLEIPARTNGGARFLVIGRIGIRHWPAVITYRQEAIRLIYVRRSRPEEIDLSAQF